MIRTRRDAWKLPSGDKTLELYAKAVAVMQKRPITDPTSWRYQAARHEYDPAKDPLKTPGETLPSQSEQGTFWNQCQHGTWFFIPWHRGYLYYFEQIIRKIVVEQLDGPATWALPYWNYSDATNPKARCLPPAFWAGSFAGITPNPLLVSQRAPGANAGKPLGKAPSADILVCLTTPLFINGTIGIGIPKGFGGGKTGFMHGGRNDAGACEGVPHGTMHDAVGGRTGWMEFFWTAALDPIFWLHHANIDRLLEVWRKRNPSYTVPTDPAWLSGLSFDFHDASGKKASLTVDQVLDTTKPVLDYVYEDVSDPVPPGTPPSGPTGPVTSLTMDLEQVPEMIGATGAPNGISLGSGTQTVQIPLRPPTGPGLERVDRPGRRQVYLALENITARSAPIESYMVYVNLPEGASPDNHSELSAGLLPRFGIIEASRPTREHPGDGLGYSFDITRIVSLLQARRSWDAERVRVTFVPHRGESEMEVENLETTLPIRVGRISVYYI